jgi:hypothetical protein
LIKRKSVVNQEGFFFFFVQWTNINNCSDLQSCTILHKANLAVNTTLQLLICLSCEIGLLEAGLLDHVRRNHKDIQWSQSERQQIKDILATQNLVKTWPSLQPTEIYPIFGGIKVQNAFGCGYCFETFTKSTLQKHLASAHSGQPKKEVSCLGQVINRGHSSVILRVHRSSQQIPASISIPSVSYCID